MYKLKYTREFEKGIKGLSAKEQKQTWIFAFYGVMKMVLLSCLLI